MTTTESIIASDALSFFKAYLKENGIEYNSMMGYKEKDGYHIGTPTLLAMIRTCYTDMYHSLIATMGRNAPTKIARDEFKDAEEIYDKMKTKELQDELKNKVRYDGSSLDELMKFVKNLTGEENQLDAAAIYSFIWQCKRKMFGLNVEHHQMTIFYSSGQGLGKTRSAKRISLAADKPVGTESDIMCPYFKDVTGDQMVDEKEIPSYSRAFVCLNDEFSKMDPGNYEKAKTLITGDFKDSRVYFTQKNMKYPIRCAFIGTSNKPINSVIFDTSGTRRFYQLNVRKNMTIDEMNEQQKVMESIDYLKIWRSVDENKEYKNSFHSSFRESFNKEAEKNRYTTSIQDYLSFKGYRPATKEEFDDNSILSKTNIVEFEQDYLFWESENCKYETPKKDLKRHLDNEGIMRKVIKVDNKTGKYYVYMPIDVPMNGETLRMVDPVDTAMKSDESIFPPDMISDIPLPKGDYMGLPAYIGEDIFNEEQISILNDLANKLSKNNESNV